MKRIVFGVVASVAMAITISYSTFAKVANCVGDGNLYPNLSTQGSSNYPIKCPTTINENGRSVSLYAKSAGDCVTAGVIATDPDACDGPEDEADAEASVDNFKDGGKSNENSVYNVILICGLCVSVTLNVVFAVLLIRKNKKRTDVVPGPAPTEAPLSSNPISNIYPTPNNER